MKIMKKFPLVSMLILSMVLNIVPVTAAENDTDTVYNRAVNVLTGLDIIDAADEKSADNTVTRGEFAEYLAGLMNIDVDETDYVAQGTGVQGDEWDYDASDAITESNSVWFYDVPESHKNKNAVEAVAEYGIMHGDGNGNFRPDEFVKRSEICGVLINALGADFAVKSTPDGGSIRAAASLGLTKKANSNTEDGIITYRDMVIMFYNTLFTEMYEMTSVSSVAKSDKLFINKIHDVYEKSGIMTANGITSLDGNTTEVEGVYTIGGVKYAAESEYTDFLGYSVVFYYREDDARDTIVFMYADDVNDEIDIDAEDIVDYTKPNLKFEYGNRVKTEYLGAETKIVYNGKALLDYSESDIKPVNGKIKLLDNDGDGNYEVAFIENVEHIYVQSIDNSEKIVYGMSTALTSIDFKDADSVISNANGIILDFSAITKDSVISVKRTLATQGKSLVTVVICNDIISGRVTAINPDEDTVAVDGVEYKISYIFDINTLVMNTDYEFSLSDDGKICKAVSDTSLEYGYIVDIRENENEDGYMIKLFTVSKNSVLKYYIGQKVIMNHNQRKSRTAVNETLLNNGELIPQLIRFTADAEMNITEILTADADENLFTHSSANFAGKTMTYRSGSKAFISGLPIVYVNSETKYINIPKTNLKNEEGYYIRKYNNDGEYTADEIYTQHKNSAVASIIIKKSDETDGSTILNSTALSLVNSTSRTLFDDETAICIEVMNNQSTKKYYITESNSKFNDAKNLKKGDLIKLSTAERLNGAVANIDVIFRASDKMMVKGSNPTANNFISGSYIMHGKVKSRTEEDYLTIAPYKYTKDDNGDVVKGNPSVTETEYLITPCKSATIYVVEGNEIYIGGSDSAVFDAVNSGKSSEVIIYTSWEEPKMIVVYR